MLVLGRMGIESYRGGVLTDCSPTMRQGILGQRAGGDMVIFSHGGGRRERGPGVGSSHRHMPQAQQRGGALNVFAVLLRNVFVTRSTTTTTHTVRTQRRKHSSAAGCRRHTSINT